MKYKVNYSGFAYVEADDEEDAKEQFEDECEVYKECGVDSIEEVEEFEICF